MTRITTFAAFPFLLLVNVEMAVGQDAGRYNVVWDTPSSGSAGSMPVGNGDIGINAWCESDGSLQFYLGKTDAWSKNGRLLKLGRVRLSMSPNPFVSGAAFRQELNLPNGEILITAGEPGEEVDIRLWVDANHPAVCIDAESDVPRDWSLAVETWRTAPRTITNTDEKNSAYGIIDGPEPIIVEPDTVVSGLTDRVVWYHRNEGSIWEDTLDVQSLEHLTNSLTDPLLHRTFGGAIAGDELVTASPMSLSSAAPTSGFHAVVVPLTAITSNAAAWNAAVEAELQSVLSVDRAQRYSDHLAWWEDFWGRHWIDVLSSGGITDMILPTSSPFHVGADGNGNNLFDGKMARAGVYNAAFSSAEIQALAATGRHTAAPADSRLVAAWIFGTVTNGVVPDVGSGAFPLTVMGSVDVLDDGGQAVMSFGGSGYLHHDHDAALNGTNGFTLEAWVAPDALPWYGARIIDKGVAGTAQGYVLDTYPGNDLRSIINRETISHDANVPAGTWVHVAVTADPGTGVHRLYKDGAVVAESRIDTDDFTVSQGYALQRFINACGGRGNSPIKFNGSLFTVDMSGFDADYRRWGPCYWWQNTRLPYWTMLAAGDFDLMQPLFKMYRDALFLATNRVQTYYDHEGAYFPETMYFWGTWNNDNYGWDRTGKETGRADNAYVRWEWQGGIELTAMMLDYYSMSNDAAFATNALLPFADEIVKLYDLRYPRDTNGTIRFVPANALETYQEGTENPMPEIAGLRYVLDGLLDLPSTLTTAAMTSRWARLRGELPGFPLRTVSSQTVLSPAEILGPSGNIENPELYAVFPYRQYGMGRPDADLARRTYAQREHVLTGGWDQSPIQSAMVGLTNDAAAQVVSRFGTKHSGSRFPAMWGPNYDWIPDQDHGNVCMTALQKMLVQNVGDRILLFPAWPPAWDVRFKVHLPGNTTMEGELKGGAITEFTITPRDRWYDVESFVGRLPELPGGRTTMALDGTWHIAATNDEAVPTNFAHTVPVPGLVDMAEPAVPTNTTWYWYRKAFVLSNEGPARAELKILKGKYGKRVLLNGTVIGEHAPNFTPAFFDVAADLRPPGATNELLVRVGRKEYQPAGGLTGHDVEKVRYMPGLYDSVELILSDSPHVAWVQTAPNLTNGTVGVLTLLRNRTAETVAGQLHCSVREAGSGARVGSADQAYELDPGQEEALYLTIAMSSVRAWSPEDPFLYELTADTPGDRAVVRFGMRDFHYDSETGAAVLNGRRYPLRGTNVGMLRFFDDADRGALPWDRAWARAVLEQFKTMHWNSLRFHVGFAPELWYELADELGIIVQDEFPIWGAGGGYPTNTTVEQLATEYAEWMVERWNHPCVCIWDGANETPYEQVTGWAIASVRDYDLSNRPWDNGASVIPGDDHNPWECHDYLFWSEPDFDLNMLNGRIAAVATVIPGVPVPLEPAAEGHPKIMNEYAWLWLNREGDATPYTAGLYDRLLGPSHSEAERRYLRAVYTASLTEYWRNHAEIRHTGIMQFCGLTRADAEQDAITGDNWLPDITTPTFDPYFARYVRDAFAPVGLMIYRWWNGEPPVAGGTSEAVQVWVKNDRATTWTGEVLLRLAQGPDTYDTSQLSTVWEQSAACTVPPEGAYTTLTFSVTYPNVSSGKYKLIAEYTDGTNGPVQCLRDIVVGMPIYTVTNTSPAGGGALSRAIDRANAAGGPSRIAFAIPETDPGYDSDAGVWTIALSSPLPALTNGNTFVDGFSQDSQSSNTLRIALTAATDGIENGLTIVSSNNHVRGLAIGGFNRGILIYGTNAIGNVVSGCHIGTDTSGSRRVPNGVGIMVNRASDTRIGGSGSNDGNVISGNDDIGVLLVGKWTENNRIVGNRIGTDAAGTNVVYNDKGIIIKSLANGNTVGGTNPAERNIISGNIEIGIYIEAANDNRIMGNLIGTDVTGARALTAGSLVQGNGVEFNTVAQRNVLGGTVPGAGNVISGHKVYGVVYYGHCASNSTIGNLIGLDITGSNAVPNATGICVDCASHRNDIAHNVISGNLNYGMFFVTRGTEFNTLRGNLIGTDRSGMRALPNDIGMVISTGASHNRVGGTSVEDRNVISGNRQAGLMLSNRFTERNEVIGNHIGVDAMGTGPLGNAQGVLFSTYPRANILSNNVISANRAAGVVLYEYAAENELVGNFIGTDRTSTLDLGNQAGGVIVDQHACSNRIGRVGAGNVIAWNVPVGIAVLERAGAGNVFEGNSVFSNDVYYAEEVTTE